MLKSLPGTQILIPLGRTDPDVSRNSHREFKHVGLPLVQDPFSHGMIGSSIEDSKKHVDGNNVEFGQ